MSTNTRPVSLNFERFLEAYTPERVAEITGLSQETIFKTALLYGRAKAGFIGWTMGVNHSTLGTATVNAICNLALLTGHIGRAGASPFSITGQCNAMGTREAGFASSLPGYRKFENAQDRADLAAIWGIDESRIPVKRGLAYPDIVEAAVGKKDPRAVDHRHEPSGFLPQSGRAAAGALESRVPGGAGRLPSDAHHRTG